MIIAYLMAVCVYSVSGQTFNLQQLEDNVVAEGKASFDQSIELFKLNSKNSNAISIAWSNLKTNIASLSADQLTSVTPSLNSHDLHNSVKNGWINKQEYYTSFRDGVSQRIMSGTLYVNDYGYLSDALYQKEHPEVFRKAYALAMELNFTNEYVYAARWNFALASKQPDDIVILCALDLAKTTRITSMLDYALKCINTIAYHKAIKIARAAGKPTVGVVVAEYKNLLDAQKTGVGFVEALKVFGWDWPGNWSNEVAQADQIVQDVYSGEIFRPTPAQLGKIRLYKGTDFLTEFVEKFNKL